MLRPPETDAALSTECALAGRPGYEDLHRRCRQTAAVPLPLLPDQAGNRTPVASRLPLHTSTVGRAAPTATARPPIQTPPSGR